MLPDLSNLCLLPVATESKDESSRKRNRGFEDESEGKRLTRVQMQMKVVALTVALTNDVDSLVIQEMVVELFTISGALWLDVFERLEGESPSGWVATEFVPLLSLVNDKGWQALVAQLRQPPQDVSNLVSAAGGIWKDAYAVAQFLFNEDVHIMRHDCLDASQRPVDRFGAISSRNRELAIALMNERLGESYIEPVLDAKGTCVWFAQKDCLLDTQSVPLFVNGSERDKELMSIIMHTHHWDEILNTRLKNAFRSCEESHEWTRRGENYLPALAVFAPFSSDGSSENPLAKFALEALRDAKGAATPAALNRLFTGETFVGVRPIVDSDFPRGGLQENCKDWDVVVRPSSDLEARELAVYLLTEILNNVDKDINAYRVWQCVAASAQASLKKAAGPWREQLVPQNEGRGVLKLGYQTTYMAYSGSMKNNGAFHVVCDRVLWKGLKLSAQNVDWRMFGLQNQSTSVSFSVAADFALRGSVDVVGLLLEDDVDVVNVHDSLGGDNRIICFPSEAEVLIVAGFRVRRLTGALDEQLEEMNARFPAHARALSENSRWREVATAEEIDVVFVGVERIL